MVFLHGKPADVFNPELIRVDLKEVARDDAPSAMHRAAHAAGAGSLREIWLHSSCRTRCTTAAPTRSKCRDRFPRLRVHRTCRRHYAVRVSGDRGEHLVRQARGFVLRLPLPRHQRAHLGHVDDHGTARAHIPTLNRCLHGRQIRPAGIGPPKSETHGKVETKQKLPIIRETRTGNLLKPDIGNRCSCSDPRRY